MTTVVTPDGHTSARQQRFCLLGDARRLRGEIEALDVLPAALRARPAVGAGIAAQLEDAVATGAQSIPPPHSISSCSTSVPSEETRTLCSRWARTIARRRTRWGARSASSARRQCSTFSAERDVERIPLDGRPVRAGVGRHLSGAGAHSSRRPRARTCTRAARRRAPRPSRAAGRRRSPTRRRRARGRRCPRSRMSLSARRDRSSSRPTGSGARRRARRRTTPRRPAPRPPPPAQTCAAPTLVGESRNYGYNAPAPQALVAELVDALG